MSIDMVSLSDIGAFPHEYTHTILEKGGVDVEKAWLADGLAEYFGAFMYGKARVRWYTEALEREKEMNEEASSEVKEWNRKWDEKYMEWGGTFEEDGFDYELWVKAGVYLKKMTSEMEDTQTSNSMSKIYGSQIQNGTGDWSYGESGLFISYLIERFGLEKVIELDLNYSNSNFEKIFGDTIRNLHAEWEKKFLAENF